MAQKKKILLYGYINTNVLDGSAVFMVSLCNVLAKNPDNQIDLLLATPYKRDSVLHSVKDLSNVNIVDPFDKANFSEFELHGDEYMSINEAGQLINRMDEVNKYDFVFIRSLDVTRELLKLNQDISKKMLTYITGITSADEDIPVHLQDLLMQITESGGRLLCQTDQMKYHILSNVDIEDAKIIDLKPMIPDITTPFNRLFKKKKIYNKFCYTGKFAKEWNTIPMISQFRELIEYYPEAKLYLAGDQFKNHKDDQEFKPNAIYLVKNSRNVEWYGALTRAQAMTLTKQADIGLTWRSHELNQSLELSTKLLEYCSLGKPPILNRTGMHVDIFGENYPFFADSEEEYFKTMEKIINNPEMVEKVAEQVYNIAKNYTFSATYSRLAPHLLTEDQQSEKQMFELVNKLNASDGHVEEGVFLAVRIDYKNIIRQARAIYTKNHISKYKIIDDILIVEYDPNTTFDEEGYSQFVQELVSTYHDNIISHINHDAPSDLVPLKENQAEETKSGNGVSESTHRKVKEFANLANEKYKETMEKYKITMERYKDANAKYKEAMGRQKEITAKHNAVVEKYKKLQAEYDTLKNRYNKLSSSKLGKVQRKYWYLRKR